MKPQDCPRWSPPWGAILLGLTGAVVVYGGLYFGLKWLTDRILS